ncbi:hypothetical protein COOONC_09584 [Cooperia oncophora]
MDGEVQRYARQNINAAGLGIRNIRSGAATVAVYVRFLNLTDVDVDGRGIRYGQLKKSQYLDISTYEGHPWIFRESGVGDLLIGQPGRISKVVQSLLVHRLQYVSMFEPNPLVGRRLRATVRRYMNPSLEMPEPLPPLRDVAREDPGENAEQMEE